jgi:hypothetical protein
MSDNEEEQELSVDEQLSTANVKPTTLNKNGKPRRQLSQEHLEKLARAREKANATRRQLAANKLEQKVEKIRKENDKIAPREPKSPPEPKPTPQPEPKVFEEEEEKIPKPKPKEKGKKKTKIIVEQSLAMIVTSLSKMITLFLLKGYLEKRKNQHHLHHRHNNHMNEPPKNHHPHHSASQKCYLHTK